MKIGLFDDHKQKSLFIFLSQDTLKDTDTGILKKKSLGKSLSCELRQITHRYTKLKSFTPIKQTLKPDGSYSPPYPIMGNIFFVSALPKHFRGTKLLQKKLVTLKMGLVNIYLSLVCSARSICLRNITKPLNGDKIYNKFQLSNFKPRNLSKIPTVQPYTSSNISIVEPLPQNRIKYIIFPPLTGFLSFHYLQITDIIFPVAFLISPKPLKHKCEVNIYAKKHKWKTNFYGFVQDVI